MDITKKYLELLMENGDDEGEEEKEVKTKKLSQSQTKELHKKLIDFFSEHPDPNDDEIHDVAEDLGMHPSDLESHIYKLLGSILGGGRSKGYNGSYSKSELDSGIKVEMEHTDNKDVAEKIAKDHLAEIPDYYTRLIKMEKEAGIKD